MNKTLFLTTMLLITSLIDCYKIFFLLPQNSNINIDYESPDGAVPKNMVQTLTMDSALQVKMTKHSI